MVADFVLRLEYAYLFALSQHLVASSIRHLRAIDYANEMRYIVLMLITIVLVAAIGIWLDLSTQSSLKARNRYTKGRK